MSNIENVETRVLVDIYETLRKSKRLEDMIDFPSLSSIKKNNRSWIVCVQYSLKYVNLAQDDLDKELSKLLYEYNNVKEITDLDDLELSSKSNDFNSNSRFCICWLLIILIKLYLLSSDVSTKISSPKDFENKILSKKDAKDLLWRGQTNSNYDFVPSIFRNLTSNEYFDFGKLLDFYKENDLLSKYIDIFGVNREEPDLKNCIDFFAYMQHSVSYSAMLDLTDKVEIATIFANNFYKGSNFNDYLNTDTAIFSINRKLLNCDVNIENQSLKDFSVQVIKGKLKYSDTIFGKHLWELSLDDLRVKFGLFSR